MRSILVTGAAGFIGSRLAARLDEAGHQVLRLDRQPARGPASCGRAPVIIADLEDVHRLYAAVRDRSLDAIVHCGGASGLMVLRDNPARICQINVLGSANILEVARVLGVRRVVLCSTIMVYGDQAPGPLVETAPLRPLSTYAASKVAAEALLQAYAQEHGVDGVALRIAHVYGPGRSTACFVREMITGALGGAPVRLPEPGGSLRQLVHVDDVVAAIERALEAEALPQPAYNITGGETYSLEALACEAAAVLGPLKVTFDESGDARHYRTGTLDIGAARRDLDYRPKIPLRDGIATYAGWLKESMSSPTPVPLAQGQSEPGVRR